MRTPTYQVFVRTKKGEIRTSNTYAPDPEAAKKTQAVRKMLQRTHGKIIDVRPWQPSDAPRVGRRPTTHQRIELQLDGALLAHLDEQAQAQGLDRSALIERLIKTALNWTDD